MKHSRVLVSSLATMIALAACGGEPAGPRIDWESWPHGRVNLPAGVTLTGELERPESDPTSGLVWVTATNTGAVNGRMTYNDCAFGVRVYADPSREADPLYHDKRVPGSACLTVTREADLGAGESVTIAVANLNLTALQGLVGGGTYTLVVTYRTVLNGPVQEAVAGTVTF